MLKIKQYVKAESLEQAYELNQKKTNRIVGGMLWLKMSTAQIQTAIDLSGLGLDQIEETEDAWKIGCMVSLRDLELHEGLNELSCNMIRESVRSIVGVQFRNLATIGGSIFGRFGFSDVLTCFLALDTEVELYKGGIISLEEFAKMERDNDILVRVIVKKTPGKGSYQSHRNTKTDFPVLAVAADRYGDEGGSWGKTDESSLYSRSGRTAGCVHRSEKICKRACSPGADGKQYAWKCSVSYPSCRGSDPQSVRENHKRR